MRQDSSVLNDKMLHYPKRSAKSIAASMFVRQALDRGIAEVRDMRYSDFCHYALQGLNINTGNWDGLVITLTHYEAVDIYREARFHTKQPLRIVDADGDDVTMAANG